MKPICPLLVSGLLLLSSIASAAVNNPPPPPDDPPTTCSTGRQVPECGADAARGYRLSCPGLHPNTIESVTRYICQTPTDPVVPVIECVPTANSVLCEAFPIADGNLIFQWEIESADFELTVPVEEGGRFVEIDCSVPWSGTVKVTVINGLSGAASFKSVAAVCASAR